MNSIRMYYQQSWAQHTYHCTLILRTVTPTHPLRVYITWALLSTHTHTHTHTSHNNPPHQHEHPGHSSPSLREKSLLLTRMMVFYEKRFPEDQELLAQFLEIILFVYKWAYNSKTYDVHVHLTQLTCLCLPVPLPLRTDTTLFLISI